MAFYHFFVVWIWICISSIYTGEYKLPTQIASKIMGGNDSSTAMYPHLVFLVSHFTNGEPTEFTGSLIGLNYILTAAHTLIRNDADLFHVVIRLGVEDWRNTSSYAQLFLAFKDHIILHPNFNGPTVNDLALIRLEVPPRIRYNVKPACLLQSKELPQTNVITAGWGDIDYFGNPPESLQAVELKIENPEDCARKFHHFIVSNNFGTDANQDLLNAIKDSTLLCAGSDERGGCIGDSGGPIFHKIEKYGNSCFEIIGITTGGIGQCATEETPGFYTNIAKYMDWIVAIAKPKCVF